MLHPPAELTQSLVIGSIGSTEPKPLRHHCRMSLETQHAAWPVMKLLCGEGQGRTKS